MVRGFSVVSKLGDDEATQGPTTGLARVIENAARIGDAKGDDEEAVRLLRNGIHRFTEAPALERARAHLYLAELYIRVGDEAAAVESFDAGSSIDLSSEEGESIRAEIDHIREVSEVTPAANNTLPLKAPVTALTVIARDRPTTPRPPRRS